MVTIIGAGITGLAAAYELARRQVPFTILEASARPGGLILTERVDGFTLEGGPDSLLAQKPAAVTLCTELGLRLLASTPPRTAFVLKGGRLHALPSPSVLGIPGSWSALAGYDLLDWRARARIALEPFVPRGTAEDESVASFFRRRFGHATVDLVAEPLLAGIHAGDVERLSVHSLFPRLVDAERNPGKVLRTLARRQAADSNGMFRAVAGGMSDLVEAIVSRLPAGSLRVHAPATALRRHPGSWRVFAGGETFETSAAILAIPARAAGALLAPVDSAAAVICRSVPYVSTASVALGWRRSDIPHPLAGSGFVVARRDNALRITACTWVSSKWQGRAPEGHALLRAFLGGAHDPGAAQMNDEALIGTAVRDVSAVHDISTAPVLARVYRHLDAGAQHNVGHRAAMARLAEHLRALHGVFVAGSGFQSIGIPDCVAHGRAVAAAAAEYADTRRD